jgi:hypothetical protein
MREMRTCVLATGQAGSEVTSSRKPGISCWGFKISTEGKQVGRRAQEKTEGKFLPGHKALRFIYSRGQNVSEQNKLDQLGPRALPHRAWQSSDLLTCIYFEFKIKQTNGQ